MERRANNRNAFTLIEILLVIVILGMLATVAVVTLRGTKESAQIDTTQIGIEKVMRQLELYATKFEYPTEDQGLAALVTKPEFEDEATGKKWYRMLAKKDLKDSWGHKLVYRLAEDAETSRKVPRVYSVGPNGDDESGEGDDIKNQAWTEESEEGD